MNALTTIAANINKGPEAVAAAIQILDFNQLDQLANGLRNTKHLRGTHTNSVLFAAFDLIGNTTSPGAKDKAWGVVYEAI